MKLTAPAMETRFFTDHPIDEGTDLDDECSIMLPPMGNLSDHGHPTGNPSVVAAEVPCRVTPAMGRFNRIEGALTTRTVDADFLIYMAYRSDITEKNFLRITSSSNSNWVYNASNNPVEFDIVLVMDAGGQHKLLEIAANVIKKKTYP